MVARKYRAVAIRFEVVRLNYGTVMLEVRPLGESESMPPQETFRPSEIDCDALLGQIIRSWTIC